MYNVGIIGLGHISSTYCTLESEYPYCHTGGIRFARNVRVAAVADLKSEAREDYRARWGNALGSYNMYNSDVEMLEKQKDLDIVAVCVRGPDHFEVTRRVIEYAPRAIFLEKPPSCSLAEMDELVRLAAEKGTILTVSYTRHWSPRVMYTEKLIKEGIIGDVTHVTTYSAGSVLSFGIHSTDLLCQFAGYCPKSVLAYGEISDLDDEIRSRGYHPEPQMNAALVEFENGILGTQLKMPGEYGEFVAEIFGTEGWAKAGIYTETKIKTNKDGELDISKLGFPVGKSPFTVAYDQIADYLDGGPLPDCTDANFQIVNELGFAMAESIRTGQKVMLPCADREFKIYANG